jgi:para-nitrobenzyl esterase
MLKGFLRLLPLVPAVIQVWAGVPWAHGANDSSQPGPNPVGVQVPQVRDTVYGKVEGVDDSARSGTYYWKGVPFAKPPVGALRWHSPLEPEPWTTPLATKAFANASVQTGRIFGPGLHNTYDASIGTSLNQAVGSEDSLYLNIWRPASNATNLPVIYFIHGGSNITGYCADPVYDGSALARSANSVVVTAHYRLGVFGWFNLPQMKSGTDLQGDSGNYGTLDQILTLKFIHRNIASFGGNPGNVTVMGQSAGAINAMALLTSPLVVNATPQLIHRAILMSGGLALPEELPNFCIPFLQPASYSRRQGQALLNALLIADHLATEDTVESYVAGHTRFQMAVYLRSKSPAEILKQVTTALTPAGLGWTAPNGSVVADSPLSAIKAGRYLKVPLLLSNTRDETKLFTPFLALSPALGGVPGLCVGEATQFSLMMNFHADGVPVLTEGDLINKAYLPADRKGTGYNARLAKLNELFFIPNRDALLKALTQNQTNIWYCQFNWDREPAPWSTVYGAAHAFDLPFVFGNFGPSVFSNAISSSANEGGRLALSAAMMAAIGAFARNGDPNDPALGIQWPDWPKTLIFDATLTDKKFSVQ